MDQVKSVEDSLLKWSAPYPFKFFKGCLPQILLGPLLNTLSQMLMADKKGWGAGTDVNSQMFSINLEIADDPLNDV